MKKLITITVAFLAIVSMNAKELCSFNPNNELGLGSDFNYNTTLYAGKIIGKTNSIVCTVGANDMYQSWSYSFSAGNGFIKGGLQGQTNPTDVNGEKPSKTLLPPVNGAFLSFEAKADGWLSVLLFASSHKAYTVFEDGKAIGYTFGAIGNASSDLGAVYQFAIQGEGQNNEVKNPIEFAEQEFLKATAPSKYNARWSWDAEGNMTWNQIKINGRGVIKFHVKKGGKYIVNANGSKMTAVGFCFDTHGNTVIKADGTTILPAGTGFYNKRTIHVATAGTLPDLIEDYEKYLIEELTLTGDLNGTDIKFIREMAGRGIFDDGDTEDPFHYFTTSGILKKLDMTNASIVAGGEPYYGINRGSRYPDSYYTSNNSISGYMFYGCQLSSIKLPNSVTSIGQSAFSGCSGLTSVTIPNSVTSIGSSAFYGCSDLTSIKVEDANEKYDSRDNCNAIIETSSNTLMVGCKNTIIPNSVTSIGQSAFSGCSGLTSVTIPNSVTSIGQSAFSGCSGLTSVTIPNSVTSIGGYAFYGCSGLTSITIPNSVTSIREYAFAYCSSLTSITIPNNVPTIWFSTFYNCSSLTSVTIGNGVEVIAEGSFEGCDNLKSVIIGTNVTFIAGYTLTQKSLKYICFTSEKLPGFLDNTTCQYIMPQTAFDGGIPQGINNYATYSVAPKYIKVKSTTATTATLELTPIDISGGNSESTTSYEVTMYNLKPESPVVGSWEWDTHDHGIASIPTAMTKNLVMNVQAAQAMSTTKARLSATVNEADDGKHYGFEWLRYNAPSNMTPYKVSAPLYNGKIVGTLSGLNPDIYYKYRPFYKADDGTVFVGEWEAFLTGDANVTFAPEVHTKEPVALTNDKMILLLFCAEGTEEILEKGFFLIKKAIESLGTRAVGGDITKVIVSGNEMSATVEGLEPGTEYICRSYVKTASGTTYGEDKTFKTPLPGDANNDGVVNVADIVEITNARAGNPSASFNLTNVDMDGNGKLTDADINAIVNKIMQK